MKSCHRFIAFRFGILLILVFAFGSAVLAQRSTSTSARRGFNLSGDIRVDEASTSDTKPLTLDILLYTKGEQLVGRQRISPNGRYRFMDLFDGDYYLVVEVESKEVARVSLFITPTSPLDFKQDIALEWRATGGYGSSGGGVVSGADAYRRTNSNKALYQKSTEAINSKQYPQAVATLRELVTADPNDFVAWSDLGMIYFVVQKDYEAAENSYTAALKANAKYFAASLNLGRVQLARKNYEGGIQTLESSLTLDPKSAAANYFLGEAYLQVKKGSKAVGYLNEALKLDPIGMADAHLRLAALYNAAGLKERAAAEYEQFLKKKPDYADREKLEKYIAGSKTP